MSFYRAQLSYHFLDVQDSIFCFKILCDPREIRQSHIQKNLLFFLPQKFWMSLLHLTDEQLYTNGPTCSYRVRLEPDKYL